MYKTISIQEYIPEINGSNRTPIAISQEYRPLGLETVSWMHMDEQTSLQVFAIKYRKIKVVVLIGIFCCYSNRQEFKYHEIAKYPRRYRR